MSSLESIAEEDEWMGIERSISVHSIQPIPRRRYDALEEWLQRADNMEENNRYAPAALPSSPGANAPSTPVVEEDKELEFLPTWEEFKEECVQNDHSGFDFHGRHFGLTYSQIPEDWAPQDFVDELYERFESDMECMTCAPEWHSETGGWHVHISGSFTKKKRLQNSACFDIYGLHPNIKFLKDKKGVKRWMQYVCKGGTFVTTSRLDMSSSHNYVKRKADHLTWKADAERGLTSCWQEDSLSLFGSYVSFIFANKRRSLWIYGASDVGKTTEVRRALSSYAYFLRRQPPYLYEGYSGENIIVSDDQDQDEKTKLTKTEICHMLNGAWSNCPTHVYGASRYSATYLKPGVNIHYIVIANNVPLFAEEEWFKSRFRVVWVVKAYPMVPLWDWDVSIED